MPRPKCRRAAPADGLEVPCQSKPQRFSEFNGFKAFCRPSPPPERSEVAGAAFLPRSGPGQAAVELSLCSQKQHRALGGHRLCCTACLSLQMCVFYGYGAKKVRLLVPVTHTL